MCCETVASVLCTPGQVCVSHRRVSKGFGENPDVFELHTNRLLQRYHFLEM